MSQHITTLLIANRGEIARRIIRTAHSMGMNTVAVYSDADRLSTHVLDADVAVPLGGTLAVESYLDIDKILTAAENSGANAVHPGYGFLSERPDFAEACIERGFIWVGPSPEAMRSVGLKVSAKELAVQCGVPTLPSATVIEDDPTVWQRRGESVGFPLLVKASAGGGGRGMRMVASAAELPDAITSARREAQASFGDPTVFLERYLDRARHVELQIIGDKQGNLLHLFERECSIQRRHQKIIEEAPSSAVSDSLRARMVDSSLALASAIGYYNAGTMEYLVAGNEYFYLETNTRLQVEHPVTEMITGVDLVRLQLIVAEGRPLDVAQRDIRCTGHSIEARVCAEDPDNDYLPAPGTVIRYEEADLPGIRYESGVTSGSEVTPYYDNMVAKVISHAPTRTEAALRLARALDRLELDGLLSNRAFLARIIRLPEFLAGDTDTGFLARHDLAPAEIDAETQLLHLMAAIVELRNETRAASVLLQSVEPGWRNVRSAPHRRHFRIGDREVEVTYRIEVDGTFEARLGDHHACGAVLASIDDTVQIETSQRRQSFRVMRAGDNLVIASGPHRTSATAVSAFREHTTDEAAGGPVAPVPGTVVAVHVAADDRVEMGQILVVLEAMKMEHRITSPGPGLVRELRVSLGDRVDAHTLLVALDLDENAK